jgi:UDP-glucose 4-epimerase
VKKILIWGASGNLGIYLTDFLQSKLPSDEFEIVAIGRRKTDFFAKRGIEYIRLDVNDTDRFSILPDTDVYAVIDLANLLPAQIVDYNPYDYFKINTIGTLNILEYMRKVNADRILFTQTYADLGGHFNKEFVLGNHLPRSLNYQTDHTVYAISKVAAEDLIENYHQVYGIKNFIFRLPNIYMYSPAKYYFVNGVKTLISYRYIIERAIQGLPIELWGDPQRARDIVYVKDFCQMVFLALLAERSSGHYNVGTGIATTLQKQIEGIIEVFSPENHPSEIIFRPDKPHAMQYVMDIENAKQELGYQPRYDYIGYLRDYKLEMELKRFDEAFQKG